MGTLLARMQWLNFLRYCGEHSIVIYLAFFLPMAVTRTLLLKTGLITDIGTISLIVTVAGVAGAVLIWRLALALRADFLFERPDAFWIAPKKAASGVAAGGVDRCTSRLSSPGLVRNCALGPGDPVRRAPSVEHDRLGVLDHPLSRVMTGVCG